MAPHQESDGQAAQSGLAPVSLSVYSLLGGECLMPQKLPQEVRPKAEASEDGPEGAWLQACLTA